MKKIFRLESENNAKAAVITIAILYIIGPIFHIHKLIVDRQYYFEIYNYLGWMTAVRYSFSWFQRILGISCAIGILFYKEIFRKILFYICIFTILTVYWKHHYPAFLDHTIRLAETYPGLYNTGVSHETMAILGIIIHSLLNIVYCLVVMHILTRPGVRKLFRK